MNNPLLCVLLALVALPSLVKSDNIDDLCKKTPYPNLCASTLHADPKSKSATTPQLGLIVVAKVEATVKAADEKARAALSSATDPALKSALGGCAKIYHEVLIGDLVASRASFSKGDYKFANDYMTNASIALRMCEGGFQAGESPVTVGTPPEGRVPKPPQYAPLPIEKQILVIYAAVNGFCDR